MDGQPSFFLNFTDKKMKNMYPFLKGVDKFAKCRYHWLQNYSSILSGTIFFSGESHIFSWFSGRDSFFVFWMSSPRKHLVPEVILPPPPKQMAKKHYPQLLWLCDGFTQIPFLSKGFWQLLGIILAICRPLFSSPKKKKEIECNCNYSLLICIYMTTCRRSWPGIFHGSPSKKKPLKSDFWIIFIFGQSLFSEGRRRRRQKLNFLSLARRHHSDVTNRHCFFDNFFVSSSRVFAVFLSSPSKNIYIYIYISCRI